MITIIVVYLLNILVSIHSFVAVLPSWASDDDDNPDPYDESATAFPAPDTMFKYTVTDSFTADIKDITVKVWYDENDNDNRDEGEQMVELETKVSRRR